MAQLDVNTRYALYYPEKRPFFLEGADIFLTPFEAVFTRTVADPLWGGKMTGKVGKGALGFFVAQDRINNLIIPSNQGSEAVSLDEDVFGGVFRYRQDIGNASTLGVLYAGRSGGDYYNHVGGIDGFFRLGKKDQIRFQYLRSQTRYSPEVADAYGQEPGAFPGDALYVEYVHQTRNWFIIGSFNDKNAGFRADSGFTNRVDTRMFDAQVQYTFWGKPKGWYNRLIFWLSCLPDQRPRLPVDRLADRPGRDLRGTASELCQRDRPRQPRILRRHAVQHRRPLRRGFLQAVQRLQPRRLRQPRQCRRLRQRAAGAPPPFRPLSRGRPGAPPQPEPEPQPGAPQQRRPAHLHRQPASGQADLQLQRALPSPGPSCSTATSTATRSATPSPSTRRRAASSPSCSFPTSSTPRPSSSLATRGSCWATRTST